MVDKWAAKMSDKSKMSAVPHVSWWQIGDQAVAMREGPIGETLFFFVFYFYHLVRN